MDRWFPTPLEDALRKTLHLDLNIEYHYLRSGNVPGRKLSFGALKTNGREL